MKAVIYDRYGSVERLRLADVARPDSTEGDVVVEVQAVALNPKDALFRKGRFAMLSGRRFPKRTGLDFAGVVVSSGERGGLRPGMRVFGALNEWRYARGTLAEEVAVDANEVAVLPDTLDAATGAALALTGLTALQALRDIAQVSAGQRVVIHGGSGGVGTIAIQIARVLGAHVTTTSSEPNFALCRSLGAAETLGYADAPLENAKHAGAFDCIFDAIGNLRYERVQRALSPGGVYVTTVPSPRAILHDLRSRAFGPRRRLVVVQPRRADLETLADWAETNHIRPVIDSRFPLSRFAEAFGVIESKRARGKVVIELEGEIGETR